MVYSNPLLRSAEKYVGVSIDESIAGSHDTYSATSKRKHAEDPDVGAVTSDDRHRFKFGTNTQEIHSR